MNAEALIGKVLGTCTLQQLIGQGGMGAVFLAQQSRPKRQVAVKVLLPLVPLAPNQQAGFLERFRRETDAAASLVHPNIMPVHGYGEQDGLAYLVMPYVSGGTLRDELEGGALPLPKVMNYLDQMAVALDIAHDRGVIHRDIKPANILKTPEGRLVLTDFGLVKIVAEGQSAQARLTGIGVPMGTPDYMAPEQIMGGEIDGRADLYSLGIILYQMVTGLVPFRGDMPMQVVMQHLHVPPQPPRMLRPDLPIAAEQVILRALAKRPADRYLHGQDLANAFRLALTASGIYLDDMQNGLFPPTQPSSAAASSFAPRSRSLFDPIWQSKEAGLLPSTEHNQGAQINTPPVAGARPLSPRPNDIVAKTSMTLPSFSGMGLPPHSPKPSTTEKQQPSTAAPSSAEAQPSSWVPGSKTLLRSRSSVPGRFSPFPPSSLRMDSSVVQQPVAEMAEGGTGSTSSFAVRKIRFNPPTDDRPTRMAGDSTTAAAQAGAGSTQNTSAAAQPTDQISGDNNNSVAPSVTRALQFNASGAQSGGENTARDGQPGGETKQSSTTTSFFTVNVTRKLQGTGAQMSPSGSDGQGATGALMIPSGSDGQGTTSMMKLTQPVKVVKVPVAGQPGRYMTGLLPVLPQTPAPPPAPSESRGATLNSLLQKNLKVAILAALVLLILFSSVAVLVMRTHSNQKRPVAHLATATPNLAATATMRADATAQANIILTDPLTENGHNWPISSSGSQVFVFKDGAYHILNNDYLHPAIALLPDAIFTGPIVYTISLQEVSGNDSSIFNRFGVMLRYSTHQANGRTATTFYCFQVNTSLNEYEFRKYDDSFGPGVYPWTRLWSQPIGHEYHFGHGANSKNTFRVSAKGANFTFTVNGKQLGTVEDNTLSSGQIGMLVNLRGTEVAFSNLVLTYN
ncbi:MAG: protein kinase [Chloroflexi bacterium]|nr:protein kinase [Chloroflexota bacterium]